MRLLVSVSNSAEAASALAGGADIVDAKDPHRGALGPVTLPALARIRRECGDRVPLTAALGDTGTEREIEESAAAFAAGGASLVKLGFANVRTAPEIEAMLRAAIRGVTRAASGTTGVIAVAYADAGRTFGVARADVFAAAVSVGATGILLDTADKDGPGLRALMSDDELRDWTARSREAGLTVAVAGKLSASDLECLVSMNIDIAGVRGAACESGRTSKISAARVSMLQALCAAASRHEPPLTERGPAAHG